MRSYLPNSGHISGHGPAKANAEWTEAIACLLRHVHNRRGRVALSRTLNRGLTVAVSQMTRLPLIAGAGSVVISDGDGGVLGAVGVSGGTPEQDRECCDGGTTVMTV